jgi:hypothetical protein
MLQRVVQFGQGGVAVDPGESPPSQTTSAGQHDQVGMITLRPLECHINTSNLQRSVISILRLQRAFADPYADWLSARARSGVRLFHCCYGLAPTAIEISPKISGFIAGSICWPSK